MGDSTKVYDAEVQVDQLIKYIKRFIEGVDKVVSFDMFIMVEL